MHLTTANAALHSANQARATTPAVTNPANPPNKVFDLFDSDEEDFFSDTGDDVTDAINHYQQLEAQRLADAAHHVHGHLESVAQQLERPRNSEVMGSPSPSPAPAPRVPSPSPAPAPRVTSQPRPKHKIRGKSKPHVQTPGASSSGAEPRGRSSARASSRPPKQQAEAALKALGMQGIK